MTKEGKRRLLRIEDWENKTCKKKHEIFYTLTQIIFSAKCVQHFTDHCQEARIHICLPVIVETSQGEGGGQRGGKWCVTNTLQEFVNIWAYICRNTWLFGLTSVQISQTTPTSAGSYCQRVSYIKLTSVAEIQSFRSFVREPPKNWNKCMYWEKIWRLWAKRVSLILIIRELDHLNYFINKSVQYEKIMFSNYPKGSVHTICVWGWPFCHWDQTISTVFLDTKLSLIYSHLKMNKSAQYKNIQTFLADSMALWDLPCTIKSASFGTVYLYYNHKKPKKFLVFAKANRSFS